MTWIDKEFNAGDARKRKGTLAIVGLSLAALGIGAALSAIPDFGLFETLVAAILIAHRSLVDHVAAVGHALKFGLDEARRAVAEIVGRDTADMDESAIARAAIESAAENFSDGVAAPVFWYLVLGLPGLLLYKTVNTADSMIGYLTERHRDFGWASARLDDLLNWIPARLTGALFCFLSFDRTSWATMIRDAGHHRSPNAGWPEAAMAASIGVALSGPRSYEGQMTSYAFVNANGRKDLNARDIQAAVRVLWRAWGALLALALLLFLL